MGKAYILDTNIVIYFLDGKLPEKSLDFVETRLNKSGSILSVITKIELLGWQAPSAQATQVIDQFVRESKIILLSEEIVEKTIEIRRNYRIKLPDAVIAATAKVYDYVLISRNDGDFRKIDGLMYENPFSEA